MAVDQWCGGGNKIVRITARTASDPKTGKSWVVKERTCPVCGKGWIVFAPEAGQEVHVPEHDYGK